MNNYYRISIILFLIIAVISCSKDSDDSYGSYTSQNTYTPPPATTSTATTVTQYTLAASAGVGGTVSTLGGTYDDGTSVIITATADDGYEFTGWNGSDLSNSTITITLNANTTLEAVFSQISTITDGNNINFTGFDATNNDSLYCISVDDSTWSVNNWSDIDSHTSFNNDCNPSTVDIIEIEKNLSVYPNPTSEEITISINNFNGNIQTEVYDLIGNSLQLTNKTTISLRDYAKGIYILKVAYGDRVEEVKVIKE